MDREVFVEKLDIRSKIIFSILFMISLLFLNRINIFISIAILIVYIINAKLNMSSLVKLFKGISLILLSIVGFNYFLLHTDIWNIVFMCYRLISVSFLLLVVVENINIFDLGDAFENLFHPLTLLKIPVYDIGMIFTISIKFIFIFFEEVTRIKKSQKARGIIRDNMKVMEKLKSSLALFLPVFICGLNHAFELATTMDLRGYQGGNRGRLRVLQYKNSDYIFLLGAVFLFITQLIIKIIF